MNAPLIWIILPGLAALGLLLIRPYRRISAASASAFSLLLCGFALALPIGKPFPVGPFTLQINDTLFVFGRQFALGQAELIVLAFIYGSLTFWCAGGVAAHVHWAFFPLSLLIAAFLTAVLAVKPFLYAALLIEVAVLASIAVLTYPGAPVGRGILRYLSFETLAMPFILYTGWMLGGIETGFPQPDLIIRSAVLLGIGFILLLAIFPFHTWLPMVFEEAHPYAAAFIFSLLLLDVFLFTAGLLVRYNWLRESSLVHIIFAVAGVMMILVGGAGAAFQEHLGRMLGYAFMSEIGYVLLAMGFSFTEGFDLFFAFQTPRMIGMGLWSLGLAQIREQCGGLSFEKAAGAGYLQPLSALGVIVAALSSAGLPLLGGFPVRLSLWELLAVQNPLLLLALFFGVLGSFLAVWRCMLVLFVRPPSGETEILRESVSLRIFLAIGSFCLLVLGVLPQVLVPLMVGMQRIFETAVP